MKPILPFLMLYSLLGCGQSQTPSESKSDSIDKVCEAFYQANKGNELPSQSLGNTGKGQLINGKLLPFKGKNFRYFDSRSYLAGRAYVHEKVKQSILESYALLDSIIPLRFWTIMECSNKNGGYFFPHNTHQNGLSVDLMMPMLKVGKPYTGLDSMGIPHYWLAFDNDGKYTEDSSISIDFEVLARQILILEAAAKNNGLHIAKVIIKIELKDELFKGFYGRKLKSSGIYVVKALTPKINDSHDEHIHVDFELR